MALASESAKRGWETTLLLGPGCQPATDQMSIFRFQTAAQLKQLMDQHWPNHDILIMAAAVSDYAPAKTIPGKQSRESGPLTLELKPTRDLLAETTASSRQDQTVIGFALEETGNLRRNGHSKRIRKGAHAIVANPLDTMDSEMVEAMLLMEHDREAAPDRPMTKVEFAGWLLDQLPMIEALKQMK